MNTDLRTQAELNKQCISQHESRIDAMEEHITIANKEMGELRDGINAVDIKVENVAKDVDWLKKFFWIVATSSIGALVTGVISLFEKLH